MRNAGTIGSGTRRLAPPLLPLVLLLTLLPALAQASVPRAAGVWESNPPAAALLAGDGVTAPELAHLHRALDLAAGDPAERFRLFEPGAAELVEVDERESFHPLQGVELIDTESRRGPPVSYPETRVWVIEVLGTTFVGEATGLSVELRPACGGFSCGVVSGDGKDPLGLAGEVDEVSAILSKLESKTGRIALKEAKKDVLTASEALTDLFLHRRIPGLSRNLIPTKDVYANGLDSAYIVGEGGERRLLLVDAKHSFFRERNARDVSAFEKVGTEELIGELERAGRITESEARVLLKNAGRTERLVVGTGKIKGVSEKLAEEGIQFLKLDGPEAARLSRIQEVRTARIKSYFTRTLGAVATTVIVASLSQKVLAGDYQGAAEEAATLNPAVGTTALVKDLVRISGEAAFEAVSQQGQGLTRIRDEKNRAVAEGD